MKRDGTLTALKSRVVYDSGAFPGAPMLPGCLLIGGYYKCENLDIQGYEVLTNKVSVGALRAPGAHNVTFAIEGHMDMMARELGLDPIEVRLKNAVEEGDPLPSGQPYPRIGLKRVPRGDRGERRLEARSKEPGARSQAETAASASPSAAGSAASSPPARSSASTATARSTSRSAPPTSPAPTRRSRRSRRRCSTSRWRWSMSPPATRAPRPTPA